MHPADGVLQSSCVGSTLAVAVAVAVVPTSPPIAEMKLGTLLETLIAYVFGTSGTGGGGESMWSEEGTKLAAA